MIGCFVMESAIGNSHRKPQKKRGKSAIWKNLSILFESALTNQTIDAILPSVERNTNREPRKRTMTTATAKTFTITDSRDGHTKTFQPGFYMDGDSTQYCHIIYKNGKHHTVTIDQARRMYRVILDCNKDAKR